MKKSITVLLISTLVILSAVAFGNTTLNQSVDSRGSWNPVSVYNNTDEYLRYIISTPNDIMSGFYSIAPRKIDVYHSKGSDATAKIIVYNCFKTVCYNKQCYCDGVVYYCRDSRDLVYNLDLVKSIVISSPTNCIITCLDGSLTSCLSYH
jgi:hypothetical protein